MVSKCFSREIEEVWKYAGRTETPIRDDRQRSVLVGQGVGGDERGLRSGGVEEKRGGGQGGGGVNRKIPSIFHLMNFLIELPLPQQIHYEDKE